jgi:hypothetical protein
MSEKNVFPSHFSFIVGVVWVIFDGVKLREKTEFDS